jgi:hypothetical protein
VFANRARVEIERLHAEAVLVRACSDLEVRLETTRQDLAVTQQSLDLAIRRAPCPARDQTSRRRVTCGAATCSPSSHAA